MKRSRAGTAIGRKRSAAAWTLLTLGLLVASVWVWSSGRTFARMGNGWLLGVREGTMLISRDGGDGGPSLMLEIAQGRAVPDTLHLPGEWQWWCWGSSRFQSSSGFGRMQVMFPIWPITLLLWVLAAMLLRSGLSARQHANANACAKCGYSLAGLAANAPCPECGKSGTPR